MANWVRLWEDMPNDPKWRVIARRSGRPIAEVIAVFVHMMTNAGTNATERGVLDNWSDEDVAASLDIEPDHVAVIRDAMQDKTLEGERLKGWEKRQPKREDGAAERAKAWRDKHRTQPNATERHATPPNAQNRIDKNRIEDNIHTVDPPSAPQSKPPAKRASVRLLENPRFEEFWSAYPRRDGSNPRQPASEKFSRFVAAGIEPGEIIDGARRYSAECERNATEGRFVAQATTWLNQQRWKDYGAPGVAQPDGEKIPVFASDAEFDKWWQSRKVIGNG